MPLFGSKHNKTHDAAALDSTTGGGRHHHTTDTGAGNFMGGPGPMNSGAGMTGHHNNAGYAADPNMNAGQGLTGTGQLGQGHFGQGTNSGQYATGTGGGGYTHASGPGTGGNIPPSNIVNHGAGNTGATGTGQPGGAGQRMTGKVESAIGSLVGSNALKTKGLQKEQEANAVKMQSRELGEAERLEREALMRRERAVGHGAHPANAALGAGHTQQPGGGAGGMTGTYN